MREREASARERRFLKGWRLGRGGGLLRCAAALAPP